MKIKELLSKEITKKVICVLLLLTIALLSIFVISKPATSSKNYQSTIQSIDEKKTIVMGVTAAAATTSAALAAIPGDATTPIANQIMDISSYLLIVVCVLVLEKSLLTVMGYLSFNFLIPIACGFLGIYTFVKKETLKILAIKFIVFALVISSIIPLSVKISDLIYETNSTTIEDVTEEVAESTSEDTKESSSWLGKLVNKVKESTSEAKENAKKILNKFIDSIALFLMAYCAVPILVVLIVVGLIKFLFGINISLPSADKLKIIKKRKNVDKTEELTEV